MDYVLDFMKRHDVPMTRDNYLAIAYMGDPPELDPEADLDLPEQFQLNPTEDFE